jgi:hypothetical protein
MVARPVVDRRGLRDRSGQQAYGFEIDACLRSESGVIGCGNDIRPPAAG